jgi:Protein of unknown function (DUF3124)
MNRFHSFFLFLIFLSTANHAEPLINSLNLGTSQGQTIFVPVYSKIILRDGKEVPLAENLSIFNTDPSHSITITQVTYYDANGVLIDTQLAKEKKLAPFATSTFFVKSTDLRGGIGANFLVKWKSSAMVSAPFIEAVMVGSIGTRAFSFSSQGRVIDTSVLPAVK